MDTIKINRKNEYYTNTSSYIIRLAKRYLIFFSNNDCVACPKRTIIPSSDSPNNNNRSTFPQN